MQVQVRGDGAVVGRAVRPVHGHVPQRRAGNRRFARRRALPPSPYVASATAVGSFGAGVCFDGFAAVMHDVLARLDWTAPAKNDRGVTVLGNNSENKAVTVMGKTTVELVGCK